MAHSLQHDATCPAAPNTTSSCPHHAAPVPSTPRTIPVDLGWPFLGHQLELNRNITQTLQALHAKHGPVIETRTMGKRMLMLIDTDATEMVLQNRDGLFRSFNGWDLFIGQIFPGSIIAMDGDIHLRHRRIMQVAFSRSALNGYLQQMSQQIPETWAASAMHASHDASTGPKTAHVRFYPIAKQLTLGVAIRAFMGKQPAHLVQKMNQDFIHEVIATMAWVRRPVPPLAMWRGVRSRQSLIRTFRPLIAHKRMHPDNDLLSHLCHARAEDGDCYTDAEVIDHMNLVMMAAHDTSTTTLTVMTYLLAKHPEWQERLRTEAFAAGETLTSMEHAEQLVAMNWVIKEALRLYPPVPAIPRYIAQDVMYDGYRLPADSLVGVYPVFNHYNSQWWTHPEAFDPLRFSPERAEDKNHRYAWSPFGGGVHKCIGQHFAMLELKATMHQMLRNYRWTVADNYTMPYNMLPIGKPRDGLQIQIQPLIQPKAIV